MARYVTYRCPECKGEFEFLHHPSDEPPPNECHLCHAYMGVGPRRVPVLKLSIGTAKGKVGDKLYRQLEDSSAARAEEAAEMMGAPVADMAGMKITNLPDNTRAGDISAPSITQAEKNLTREAMGQKIGPAMQNPHQQVMPQGQVNPQVAGWVGETTSGDHALTTRKMLNGMQQSGATASMIAQKTSAGTIARWAGK